MPVGRIADELESENLLISYNLYIDEGNSSQCVYPLTLLTEGNISPKRFARLYDDLMKIVTDNQLADCEQFTITGSNSGTIYRHYMGNLCVETIERECGKQLFFQASWDRPIFSGVGEDAFGPEQFNGLKDSCYDADEDLDIDTTMKIIKPILKNIGNSIMVNASKPHRDSIMVTLQRRGSRQRVFLTYNDGLWWVYANSIRFYVPTLSCKKQATACTMFLRLVSSLCLT